MMLRTKGEQKAYLDGFEKGMTYGYCVYHEIECDYKGSCIDCPHNTEEDVEWFKQDEAESEDKE